jgi:hypothetical protein
MNNDDARDSAKEQYNRDLVREERPETTAEHPFRPGQRVRMRGTRRTGRVTATWTQVEGGWPGVDVTMDETPGYAPGSEPARFTTSAQNFGPLPEDYLDDEQALERIAAICRPYSPVRQMLAEILGVLRRNDRVPPGKLRPRGENPR